MIEMERRINIEILIEVLFDRGYTLEHGRYYNKENLSLFFADNNKRLIISGDKGCVYFEWFLDNDYILHLNECSSDIKKEMDLICEDYRESYESSDEYINLEVLNNLFLKIGMDKKESVILTNMFSKLL
jgi:hypothetical protein